MPKNLYIEDLFVDFYSAAIQGKIELVNQDHSVCLSFYTAVEDNKALTEKQSNYLLRILSKYQRQAEVAGVDCGDLIQTPVWKHPFRVVDNTKLISVEQDETKTLWIVIKMPYILKEKLDTLIQTTTHFSHSAWDSDRQVRKIKFYNCNLILLNDFATENNFVRDESFLYALATVEQIWQDQEIAAPMSRITNGVVELINAPQDAATWWDQHQTNDVAHDLFLAKGLGYPALIDKLEKTVIEKITSSAASSFWTKNLTDVFDIFKKVNGAIAVIVNKDRESLQWVQAFALAAQTVVDNTDIKICFRLSKHEDNQQFNDWIKDSGFGGSIESGKIFIFQGKPAKWLFSNSHDVKLIVTNSLYPIPSSLTQDWMASHPCVLYVGEQKASNIKDKTIVEL